MKLLIVSPYLPHPASGHGTGVFMYGLLREITSRHSVTLLSFCSEEEMKFVPDLQKLRMEIITIPRRRGARHDFIGNLSLIPRRLAQFARSVVRWEPMYVSKYHDSRLSRRIEQLTSQNSYDIVQLEMTMMAQYLPWVKSGKTVLHEHDVAFRPAYRSFRHADSALTKLFMWIEWCRWSGFERIAGPKFDRVICVTEQDRMLFRRITGSERVSYFPRGVDVVPNFPDFSKREPATLLFVGTYSHEPNVDAALWLVKEIFPTILKKIPSARLVLIGKDPPAELSALAAGSTNIKLLGFVDDLTSHLLSASCFVAPLRFGGGVKIKLLHAVAHGIPVVSTRIGIEGIEGIDAGNVYVGDSAESIARHAVTALSDSTAAAARAKSAWEAIKRYYSWEGTVRRLEEIYEETTH